MSDFKVKKFDQFRFEGLNPRYGSNKYYKLDRVSDDKSKIIVRFAKEQVFKTQYGYGFIVGEKHVVWLKDWQVDFNYFADQWDGCEILLNKEFYSPKVSNKPFEDIFVDNDKGYYGWEELVATAEEQDKEQGGVHWNK